MTPSDPNDLMVTSRELLEMIYVLQKLYEPDLPADRREELLGIIETQRYKLTTLLMPK